jgi:hypothetical protein
LIFSSWISLAYLAVKVLVSNRTVFREITISQRRFCTILLRLL